MSRDLYSSESTSIQASCHAAYVNRTPPLARFTGPLPNVPRTCLPCVLPFCVLWYPHSGGVLVDCVPDLAQYFIISRKIGLIDMTGSVHKADQ